jgi:AraC-like DNA-binding protein
MSQTLIVAALDGFTQWRNDLPAERQEPPSGRVSLVISAGAPFRVDVAGVVVTAHSFVVGMFDRPARTAVDGPAWGIQVDLHAAAAYALTGGDVMDLTNRVTPVDEVIALDVDRLLERIASAPSTRAALARFDAELAPVVSGGPALTPQVQAAWDLICGGAGTSIGAVAERVGWSRSHLVKRFHREIGLPPKSVARLSRFRYALGLLETSRPLAVVAAVAGYADQAHMTREFRGFTGSTPGQVRASGGEATFVQDEGDAGP